MRLLIDTNIFLEVILRQDRAKDAQELLSRTDEHEFFMSDYSFHSIGLIFFRRKQYEVFRQFFTDMIFNTGVKVIGLLAEDMEAVINTAQKFNLDFDDAYQYVAAEKYELALVSLDADFDRTEHGRKTPLEALKK